jgi:hypothetical protein
VEGSYATVGATSRQGQGICVLVSVVSIPPLACPASFFLSPTWGGYIERWKRATIMIDQFPGKARNVGLGTDFMGRDCTTTGQIEVHPRYPQREVRQLCARLGIAVVAYASLGCGALLRDPTVTSIAAHCNKTPSQVGPYKAPVYS